jgi:TonB family protein
VKDKPATVRIVVMVGEDGNVHDPQLAQTSGYPVLDAVMMRQITLWHFFPATLDGKPMASMALFKDDFKLDN